MRVNLCVNGTFRYPDYARHYDEAGALGRFYFAHRRSCTAAQLGLPAGSVHNLWPKQYAVGAAFRFAPQAWVGPLSTLACDAWQDAVIRRWTPCDSLESVVGAVADRVIAFAKRDGTRVLGHPVTSHPAAARRLVNAARDDLGLSSKDARPADDARREAEIAACDALLVDSHVVARSFVQAGVPSDTITVVHPHVDGQRFHPRHPADCDRSTFLVVCVGIVTPRKSQHVLLRAWRKLRLPRAKLVLVGARGADAQAVLAGHDGSYTHVPHIAQADLRRLLVRASCFVLPSAEDGFGQAALEAMACGVPVILSRAVGAAELVTPGVSGFVIEPGDVEALAAHLERLYRDRDLVAAMGIAAADAAAAHNGRGWSDYVARVLAIHRQLLDPSLPREIAA